VSVKTLFLAVQALVLARLVLAFLPHPVPFTWPELAVVAALVVFSLRGLYLVKRLSP